MMIEQYAYRSAIKEVDPKVKLFFSMVLLSLSLFTQQIPTVLVIFSLALLATTMIGRIPLKIVIQLLWLPIAFLSVGVLGILLSYSKDLNELVLGIPLWSGFIGMTKTGINQSILVVVKAITATSSMYFLILTTPMMSIMSALKQLRLPTLFVLLMELMYRFIFIVMEAANGIYIAQKARLGYSTYGVSYGSLGKLASVLLVRSFLRIDALFRALEARGYDGEIQVLEENYSRYDQGYAISLVMAVAIILMDIGLTR
jgi:cobalt/nickel transport system permease protein